MKKLLFTALLLAVLLAAAGAMADQTVVCSFYPLRVIALNVLDNVEGVTVETLAPAGTGCLHDFQLLPGDLKKVDSALCLVINGAGMEDSFLPLLKRESPDLPLIDCSAGIDLIDGDGGPNAHIWLDARNAARMTDNLAEGLIALLPDKAEQIRENADAYKARLLALDAEMQKAAEAFAHRDIATFHEAFPYFARELGLRVAASVTADPDETPSPREIARTVEQVRACGVCPLFTEPGVRSDALDVVARESGQPVYTLSPVTDGNGTKTDYEDQMRENIGVLNEALGTNP